MIAGVAALLLCALMAAWVFRALTGPTLHDRALGAHGAALTACLLGAALAALAGRPAWIDVALALLVGDLVLIVTVLRVFRLRSLQAPLARLQAPPRS